MSHGRRHPQPRQRHRLTATDTTRHPARECVSARPAPALPTTEEGRSVALTIIEEALRRIRRGEMVLVVDDEDREHEGDRTMAARWRTAAPGTALRCRV